MGDVSLTEADDRRDRGQIILVGGIVVAFAIVALVLLLNAALFAENVSTRGLGAAPDDARGFVTFSDRAADRILREEENIEYDTWPNARDNTTRNVRRVDRAAKENLLRRQGALTSVSVDGTARGSVLIQNDSTRALSSRTGAVNWTLADSSGGIRNYTMRVNGSDLLQTPSNVTNAFTVSIEGENGRVWKAYVYANASNRVVVNVPGATPCRSDGTRAVINWTEGTLDGCSFPYGVNQSGTVVNANYTLNYTNGDEASGTYRVVVRNEAGSPVQSSNFYGPSSTGSPREYSAVYSLNLSVSYDAEKLEYETGMRSAPGEPTETAPDT